MCPPELKAQCGGAKNGVLLFQVPKAWRASSCLNCNVGAVSGGTANATSAGRQLTQDVMYVTIGFVQ